MSREIHNLILSKNEVYNEIIACHHCKAIAFEPTFCPNCDKVFCMACLAQQVDEICPLCLHKIDITALKPSLLAQKLIDGLGARCIHEGCDFRGTYAEVVSHLGNCDFINAECPLKCDQILKQRNLAKHLNDECPNRKVTCIQSHLGCPWKGEHFRLVNHVSECLFDILSPAFEILRQENRQLKEQVAALTKSADDIHKNFEPTMTKLREDIDRLYISTYGYTWHIPFDEFSSKKFDEVIVAEPFELMGKKWILEVYPNGAQYIGYDGTPCLFLRLADPYSPTLHVKCVFFVDHPYDKRKTKEMSYIHESGKGYGGKVDINLKTENLLSDKFVFDDGCVHVGVVIKTISIEALPD